MGVKKIGGRYLISGSQVGILVAYIRNKKTKESIKVLEKIMDKQFVGDSDNKLEKDIKTLQKLI
jgi:hypothetical protein